MRYTFIFISALCFVLSIACATYNNRKSAECAANQAGSLEQGQCMPTSHLPPERGVAHK